MGFIRDHFREIVESISAVGVLLFTALLWWIERQRSQWSREPIFTASPETSIVLKDNRPFMVEGQVLISNVGEGQALDCRLEWSPNDVPAGSGILSQLNVIQYPTAFTLDRGQTQSARIEFSLMALADGKSPHWSSIDVKTPYGDMQNVGIRRNAGQLTIEGKDRVGKKHVARFDLVYEGYNDTMRVYDKQRLAAHRVK